MYAAPSSLGIRYGPLKIDETKLRGRQVIMRITEGTPSHMPPQSASSTHIPAEGRGSQERTVVAPHMHASSGTFHFVAEEQGVA